MDKLLEEFYSYFHDTVLLTYMDYIQTMRKRVSGQNKDMKMTASIISILYHLRERLPHGTEVSRGSLEKINGDFEILADINNVIKHGKIDIKRRPNAKVLTVSDIFEVNVVTLYEDEIGEYSDVCNRVFVRLYDKSERDVEDIITSVMNMWIVYLAKRNIISRVKCFPQIIKNEIILRENARGVDFKVSQGIGFKSAMLIYKYNYTTKTAEPVDMSGSDIQMRIYEPKPIFVRIQLVEPQSKVQRLLVLTLTTDELSLVNNVDNEINRAGLQNILNSRKVICLRPASKDELVIEIPLTIGDYKFYTALPNEDEVQNFLKPFLDTAFMNEQDVSEEMGDAV